MFSDLIYLFRKYLGSMPSDALIFLLLLHYFLLKESIDRQAEAFAFLTSLLAEHHVAKS